MAASSCKAVDEKELTELLLLNIEDPIPIVFDSSTRSNSILSSGDNGCLQKPQELCWGKSLVGMPLFGIKDIEKHRLNSGKSPGNAIIKTLERGKKFKEERFISADSIFTCLDSSNFNIKALCKASMKKDKRNVFVRLNKVSGDVESASCSCPAGKSGYCNHVMALLFEIADYSLSQLQCVPEEISCTSRLRQWGIPGEANVKAPVMSTAVQRDVNKRGISSTLFCPHKIEDPSLWKSRVTTMHTKLKNIDPNAGFAVCIPFSSSKTTNTPFGEFDKLSPLSYHLNPIPFHLNVVTNLVELVDIQFYQEEYVDVPLKIIASNAPVVPQDWKLTSTEQEYIYSITPTEKSCRDLERDSTGRHESKLWFFCQRRKIVSTEIHKVFIRKKNFDSLTSSFLPNDGRTNNALKDPIKHQKNYEPIARDLYEKYLDYHLNHDCDVRVTGIVIQPHLPWLVALPDSLVSDRSRGNRCHGIVLIKCPYRKRNTDSKELFSDPTFFLSKENNNPNLKKDHPDGYFTEAQATMGLTGASFCDFVTYTFKTLIITRVEFDELFFIHVIRKINNFYKDFLLPKIIERFPLSEDEEL